MTLKILATGGTFDKHYDEIAGKLTFAQSHLAEVIQRSRMTAPCTLDILFLRDSLDMSDADRENIMFSCQQASESKIVIIHGTDTMPETAQVLGAAKLNKTIVLTGAMIPYEIAGSDAFFNFGFACAAARMLLPGVYVAMNGQTFDWQDVQKNRIEGIFQTVDSSTKRNCS